MVDLHRLLAVLSLATVLFAGIEGGARAARGIAPGRWADRASSALLIVLGMTSAGGLGLFVSGRRPQELLHVIYATLAFASLPFAASLTRAARPRSQGLAAVLASAFCVVVIARLFATG